MFGGLAAVHPDVEEDLSQAQARHRLAGDPEPNFDPQYTDVNKTPLSVEVVDRPEPGHYDLTLTRGRSVRPKAPSARANPLGKQQMERQTSGG